MDSTYHYPPELFSLLKEVIPKLVRSKKDVLAVFRGAGVRGEEFQKLRRIVDIDRDSINKYEITQRLLTDLNEKGDAALSQRRKLLQRVVEWEDFSTCWDGNVHAAKGLVSDIRRVVNVKDSFTRMKQEREKEKRKSAKRYEERAAAAKEKRETKERVKKDLFNLFSESNPQARGQKFEKVLTDVFELYGISISESFTRSSHAGTGVIEQVDGALEMDGHIYLVEAKWHNSKVGVGEISQHLQRIFSRADARAIIISASGFTSAAIETTREALSSKVVVLCELKEIVQTFIDDTSLTEILRKKIRAAQLQKEPFVLIA